MKVVFGNNVSKFGILDMVLTRFKAHHPPTFKGGGDPMEDDHWFRKVDIILEAMEITSDATRKRLANESITESQVW